MTLWYMRVSCRARCTVRDGGGGGNTQLRYRGALGELMSSWLARIEIERAVKGLSMDSKEGLGWIDV